MDRILRRDAVTRKRGAAAEDLAAHYLARNGLAVLEKNFRVRGGEIDLICRDGDSLVFVEVRLRGSAEYGGAAASVTVIKQRRIIQAARHWLAKHGEQNCRFDCVLLDALDESRIEWIRNAFAAE